MVALTKSENSINLNNNDGKKRAMGCLRDDLRYETRRRETSQLSYR